MLAIDYRGFADSSPVDVTESTLLEDSLAALAWVKQKLDTGDRYRIFLSALLLLLRAKIMLQIKGIKGLD